MSQMKQQGQNWAQFRKEFLKCDWTSDAKICMSDVQVGDLSDHKRILQNSTFWLSDYFIKNGPEQVYAGDDNHSCRILTVILNQIDRLQVPQYNIYSGTFFYTDISIYTLLRGAPFGICHPNISVRSPARGEILFSLLHPFLVLLLNLECFGHFVPDFHYIFQDQVRNLLTEPGTVFSRSTVHFIFLYW